ncbi:putative extracellular elastinolytic metalloproteinase [Diaporthe ampelina]|uniref:Extracellular metalloproteinase n=1 Tax=Diaporthe ampelina TaxID=1214573 RepID=A0A0G2FJ18_9PEZI|nr:putative extracellular elastinolytic metalloproteinase [Diaporthe ampelina]
MICVRLLWLSYAASLGSAHPTRGTSSRVDKRATLLDSYRFSTPSTYTTLDQDSGIPSTDWKRDEGAHVQKILPGASFRVADDYYVGTNNVGHVHFQQIIDGIDVDTAYFKVNILENGTVLSFGHSFHADAAVPLKAVRRDGTTITPVAALESAVKLLDLPIKGIAGAVVEKVDGVGDTYIIKHVEGSVPNPTAKLVYLISYIDAAAGSEVAGVTKYTNMASYEAFPWDGNQSYENLHGKNAYVTIGDATSNKVVAISPSLIFSYPYSPDTTDWQTYVNASATQAFYTVNKFHDILYALGFDEAAGNFQVSNNGKGGRAGDPVEITVHSSLGETAVMTTPADGSSPRLSLGIWTGVGTPYRDSAFDSTVLLHEYMHGVTVRLVGGPATSGCLSGSDGLSLNEGYSDLVPTLLRVKAGDTRNTDYTIADWATGEAIGLRSHYISTSLQTTPLTFESLNALSSSGGYDLATVWAAALYEVFWNLVDTYGIGDVDKVTLVTRSCPAPRIIYRREMRCYRLTVFSLVARTIMLQWIPQPVTALNKNALNNFYFDLVTQFI